MGGEELGAKEVRASNELALIPHGKQPTYPIVYEKLRFMESCIQELNEVVRRLVRVHLTPFLYPAHFRLRRTSCS